MADRVAEVEFEVGGERCAGWLHLPESAGPHPCVVMLHSTAGLRQMRCYAGRGEDFASAGIATLQFDCRGFGASEGEPRQLFDVRRQAEDLAAALAFARRRKEVDPERLALWGASASCAQVLAAASEDTDIRAVVCLTPFVPSRATQRSAGTPIVRLATAALADRLRMAIGRDPKGVAVGGEPGTAAILVREDAAAREAAMLPPEAQMDASGDRAELPGGVISHRAGIPCSHPSLRGRDVSITPLAGRAIHSPREEQTPPEPMVSAGGPVSHLESGQGRH